MGIFGKKEEHSTGFTIVELIIVITIIAILAGIVLVAYPGYQARTRDNERKNDLAQISSAFGAYAFQKNTYVGLASGCGRNGNGNGWFNAGSAHSGAGTYPRSILQCLQDIKALNPATSIDPSGCVYDSSATCGVNPNPTKAYMKASCTKSGTPVTYVFANLESQPRKNAEVDALCDDGTVSGFTTAEQKWGTRYGMNYYLVIK